MKRTLYSLILCLLVFTGSAWATGTTFNETFGDSSILCWASGSSACSQTWIIDSGTAHSIASTPAGSPTGSGAYSIYLNGAGQLHTTGSFPNIPNGTTSDLTYVLYIVSQASSSWTHSVVLKNQAGTEAAAIMIHSTGSATSVFGYSSPSTSTGIAVSIAAWHTVHLHIDATAASSYIQVDGGTTQAFTMGSNSVSQVYLNSDAALPLYIAWMGIDSAIGGGAPPSAFLDWSSGSNGTALTAANMLTSTHCGNGIWTTPDGAPIFTNAQSQTLPTSITACGTAYPGNVGLSITGDMHATDRVQYNFLTTGHSASFGFFYQSNIDSSDTTADDFGGIVNASSESVTAQTHVTAGVRGFYLEVAQGATVNYYGPITYAPNSWYGVTVGTNFTTGGTHYMNIYTAAGALVGSVSGPALTTGLPTNFVLMHVGASASGAGYYYYFDNVMLDYASGSAKFPLLASTVLNAPTITAPAASATMVATDGAITWTDTNPSPAATYYACRMKETTAGSYPASPYQVAGSAVTMSLVHALNGISGSTPLTSGANYTLQCQAIGDGGATTNDSAWSAEQTFTAGNACVSQANTDWATAATWTACGGSYPHDNDTVEISNGNTVHILSGTSAFAGLSTGTSSGVKIDGSSSGSYGSLIVDSGGSLTARGVNITTYPAILINRYGVFTASSGSTLSVNATGDYQTCIVSNGHFTATGATLTIPTGNIVWTTQSTKKTAGTTSEWWDHANHILINKLYNVTNPDPGPIANAAHTGVGSFRDSSLVVDGGGTWTNQVASYAAIASNGDYYVDYVKGVVWYKAASKTLTALYQFYYGTWFSTGIISTLNQTSGSSLDVNNCTIDHWGSNGGGTELTLGGAFMVSHKQPSAVTADNGFTFTGNTCTYCSHVLTLYSNTGMDATHLFQVTGNTFTNCRWAADTGDYTRSYGLLAVGYTGYINFSHNIFNSLTAIFSTVSVRPSAPGIQVSYNCGDSGCTIPGNIMGSMIPKASMASVAASTASHNYLSGYGYGIDNREAVIYGGSLGQNTIASDNRILHLGNAVAIQSYMTVTRNEFSYMSGDGIAVDTSNDYSKYLHAATITNNLFHDSIMDATLATDEPGGAYLGTRFSSWVDGIILANNTLDTGSVGISFSRMEGGTPALVTFFSRGHVANNIVSNSYSGIYRPADAAAYITKLAPARLDYNVDYGNSGAVTNTAPSTFMMGGAEYNTSGSKTAGGVYLFTPSYTLPCATSRTLAITASGTIPLANIAETISWGGGATQNVVVDTGTVTATGQTTTQLTDSGKSWTAHAYQGYQVIVYDATHGYQYALITDNAATTLTLLANVDGGALAFAPTGSVSTYAIINSELTLIDNSDAACGAGARTVHAGIYSPELVLTSQSDTGVSIATNVQTGDPKYTSSTNWLPLTTGSGVDKGTSVDAPSVDIIGTVRPQHILFDIGAYETLFPATGKGGIVGGGVGRGTGPGPGKK